MTEGKFWKEKRAKYGLTQNYVAKELGLTSPQFISNFERDKCSPSRNMIAKLTEIYHVPKKEVFEFYLKKSEKDLKKLVWGE